MRALNCNKPPELKDLWVQFLSDTTGQTVPVTAHQDPNNSGRTQIVFADDEAATGGGVLMCRARGWNEFDVRANVPPAGTAQEGPSLEMTQSGVDPFSIPTEELLNFRGSIWTARAKVPFGPRPMQDDNILAMDYFESYNDADQQTMLEGYVKQRGYRHAPFGALIDEGYHGQYPGVDFRTNPAWYAGVMQKMWNGGAYPVLFMSPNNWSHEDCENILTPIYQMPEFQRVVRLVVPYGWEPGGYNISNADWVRRFQWARRCFPNAIMGIHMIADFDAPIGGNDGAPIGSMTKQEAWTNVANAGAQFFLDQVAGYINGPEVPTQAFIDGMSERVRYFVQHFRDWGIDLSYIGGEYAAYADYWQNFNEKYAVQIGKLCMDNGARGFFDGGPT